VNLNPKPKWNKADMEAWKSGLWSVCKMGCDCGHRWVCVTPAAATLAECPSCHEIRPITGWIIIEREIEG
jgi:hypothetical protein